MSWILFQHLQVDTHAKFKSAVWEESLAAWGFHHQQLPLGWEHCLKLILKMISFQPAKWKWKDGMICPFTTMLRAPTSVKRRTNPSFFLNGLGEHVRCGHVTESILALNVSHSYLITLDATQFTHTTNLLFQTLFCQVYCWWHKVPSLALYILLHACSAF